MKRIPAKNIWTVAICLMIAVCLPLMLIGFFRFAMARFLTRDNAGIVFDQFQLALDKGNRVRDPIAATDVATNAYWAKTQAVPLDGWGHLVRISAVVKDNTCQLIVLSAGRDGIFGTDDDVILQRNFDVSTKKPTTHLSAP